MAQQHRKRQALFSLALLYSLLAALWGFAPSAYAEDTIQFGIRPANAAIGGAARGYFILAGQPGQVLRDTVIIANTGKVAAKLQLSAVDATTSSHGGASYLTSDVPRTGVGAWITLDTSEVELLPQKQVSIGFTITIPRNIQAGQHLGGLAVQPQPTNVATTQPASGMGVTTITRALTAVQINVAGAPNKPSLLITGAQIGPVEGLPTLTLNLQNNGNTMVKPVGKVTLSDTTGKTMLDQKLSLDTLLPGDTIAYPVQADPPTQPGTYRVQVSLDFGGSASAVFEGQVVVTATPTAVAAQANTGRARPTQADGATQATDTTAAATAQNSTENNSPVMLILLLSVSLVLLLTTIGLGAMVLRSKKHHPASR